MNTEVLEKIEDYLAGRIDRAELEAAAKANQVADLDAEIEWVRDAQTAIEANGLREQLRITLPAVESTPVRRLRPRRRIWALVASVLILIAAGLWFTLGTGEPTGQLYASYEYVDPGLPVLMSQSEDYELYDALTYYGEGNYAVAIEKLRALQAAYAGNDTLDYYLGASLLYSGQPEAARTAFERVDAEPGAAFAERVQWLRVLAALRENNRALAEPLLTEIANSPNHRFHSEARRLQVEWEE